MVAVTQIPEREESLSVTVSGALSSCQPWRTGRAVRAVAGPRAMRDRSCAL